MPSRRSNIGLCKLVLAMGLAALLPPAAQPVRAEVRVSGQADALIVETREASVEEILAALRASFNLHYRISGALNRVITGTYSGSLQRVVARLLEGHNYVMQASAGGGELIIFGPGAAGGSAPTEGRQVAVGAQQRELLTQNPSPAAQVREPSTPIGRPLGPPLPNANSTRQGPAGALASSGFPAIETLMPPLLGRNANSDTATPAMLPLPNATPGVVWPPVPTVMAAGDVPALSAVNTPMMLPPMPNPAVGFGPPIVSHPAGIPIPQPLPGGNVGP